MSLLGDLRAVEVFGEFSGGNDEGFMDHVYLVYADGRKQEVHASSSEGIEYVSVNGTRQPIRYQKLVHPTQTKINKIIDILWRPVSSKYGGFGGTGHVAGVVRWDGSGEPTIGDSYYGFEWGDD